jgi:hypothetical protein
MVNFTEANVRGEKKRFTYDYTRRYTILVWVAKVDRPSMPVSQELNL